MNPCISPKIYWNILKSFLNDKQGPCILPLQWRHCLNNLNPNKAHSHDLNSISMLKICGQSITACKVSKYGVISGSYFSLFSLNTRKYGPEITPYLDTFHAVNFGVYFSSLFR